MTTRYASPAVLNGLGTTAPPPADALAPPAPATQAQAARRQQLGLWLGLLGVVCFAVTLPATRLATGSFDAPQLSPAFVTIGRLAVAGVLSALFLLISRSKWPPRETWGPLALAIAGSAIGFPLLLALAVRHVTAAHAAVVLAALPLATAVLSARVLGLRARPAFWGCAALGSALVMVYMALRAAQAGAAGQGSAVWWSNGLLLGTVASAAVGYVYGAKVTPALGAERVICWMCVTCLPVALPLAWWLRPTTAVSASAWAGFAYVGAVSMWAGFFAWYRGLDWGGALRVSQIQLLQPFLAMLLSWPLLGEVPHATSLVFALAVMGVVFTAQRLSQPKLPPSSPKDDKAAHN